MSENGDSTDAGGRTPTPVAASLCRTSSTVREDLRAVLAEKTTVSAVDVPLSLLPPILAARDQAETENTWSLVCRPDAIDVLGRSIVLGTAVAEAIEEGALTLRVRAPDACETDTGGAVDVAPQTLFAGPDWTAAVSGPVGEERLLTSGDTDTERRTDSGSKSVQPDMIHAAIDERVSAAASASVGMPSRRRLHVSARKILDDRFAGDVVALLDALEYGAIGRQGPVTDRVVLVALAARHDQLFSDLRAWIGTEHADGVGIAAGQELTAARRSLVDRGVIESIRVPMGPGRPRLRLRAVDGEVERAHPAAVVELLRERYAASSGERDRSQHGYRDAVRHRESDRL